MVPKPTPFEETEVRVEVLGKETNYKGDITGYDFSTLNSEDMSNVSPLNEAGVLESYSTANKFTVPRVINCKIKSPGEVVNLAERNDDPVSIDRPTSSTAVKDREGPRHRSKLLHVISRILASNPKPVHPPPFIFKPSADAASHNFNVLKKNNMSLDRIFDSSPFSPCSFGSEFRDTTTLKPLFGPHPAWKKICSILEKGSAFPMVEEPDEVTRLEDLKLAITRGNHKSASGEKEKILIDKISQEIERGWCLPLLPEHVSSIPKAWFAPMGVAEQNTINDRGEFIPKNRQTHDQSFVQAISKMSANGLVDKTKLEPCKYGHMASRLTHFIVGCRARNPNTRILISKADIDSAYRRSHVNLFAAAKSLMWLPFKGVKILVMCLRLTFGGSPWPSEWSCLSEPICDLTNALLKCPDWDPEELYSPLEFMYPMDNPLTETIPFGQARDLAIHLPNEDHGKCDLFLDDLVSIIVDKSPVSRKRLRAAVPLAIDATVRPLAKNEPLPRDPFLKQSKVTAEGALEEIKTILGWVFDTRRLKVSLPQDKYKAWSSTIESILQKGTANQKELETMIGRQTHAAAIMPMARHFICRIRYAQSKMNYPNQEYKLKKHVLEDLRLALDVLDTASKGISMNLLTFRLPSIGYFVDACEHGLGGWNSWGIYWFIEFPDKLLGRAHINLLEFLASLIGPWIDILQGRLHQEDCFVVLGESTTAEGWVHRPRYKGKDESDEDFTARLTLRHGLKNYTQWFPGRDNVVADFLSRDGHL